MSFMTILTWAIIVMFTLAAAQSARLAYTRKLPDLYWLAGNFAAAIVGNFFSSVISVPLLSMLGLLVASICMVMFVHRAFYRDRKSPYLLLIGLLVVVGAWQMYSIITNPASYSSLSQLGFWVVWGWQAWLAIQSYRRIASDRTVEDWVKARYLLWFGYTFVMFALVTRMLLPLPMANFEYYITSPLLLLAVIVQYTTWAMPEPVRLFLNRGYKPVVSKSASEFMAMSEEDLLKQVQA